MDNTKWLYVLLLMATVLVIFLEVALYDGVEDVLLSSNGDTSDRTWADNDTHFLVLNLKQSANNRRLHFSRTLLPYKKDEHIRLVYYNRIYN